MFVYPVHSVYGDLDLSYLNSVYFTTYEESKSYMKIISFKTWGLLLIFLFFCIWLIKQHFYTKKNVIIPIILFIFLIIFPIKKYIQNPKRKLDDYANNIVLKKLIFITNGFYTVKKENDFIQKELKRKDTWTITENNRKKQNIVIVIGESVRKDILHSYGFPIKNTEFIENSPHITFQNYTSSGWTTVYSLKRTLALSNNVLNYELNNDIISLAKKAGYKTYWISNQNSIGKYDSPISLIGKKSDYSKFYDGKIKDIEILKDLNEIINDDKNQNPKLIILHMMGSHPRVSDRTEDKYDEYIISKDVSCYNKTIKNLDNLLKNTYLSLKKTNKSFDMVYFSDHGLYLNSDKTLTHSCFKECFDVPLFIWSDEISSSQKIQARRNAHDFLLLFSQLCGIKTQNIRKNYHFISEENNQDEKNYILKGDNIIIDYDTLKSNPLK